MIPADLNVEEFARNLAEQAAQAFPPDLPDGVKKAVTQVVYEFIKIAGDALNKEEHQYDINESVLICQLVGEWMYHKGIDNFKNQIPQEYWRPILQQIAFAIFETAKNAVLAGDGQDSIIDKAQMAVEGSYRAMIEQLAKENKLSKSVDEIMHQSNLNDYVEQNYKEEEIAPQQEERDLKLMTIALFFKSLSPDDVGKMVKMLNDDERRQIMTYINMPDLEKLVDPGIYSQYLEKFNNFMPKVQMRKKKESMYHKITEALSSVNEEEFSNIISKERKNVKNFLLRVYNGKMSEEEIFPLDLTNEIIEYAVHKVNN
ncbi:MAG: hypothetical protein K6A44_03390 [bacterium]|nr:hypothetical protein [bacterium]